MDGVQDSIFRNNLVYGNGRHAMRGYDIDASAGPRNLTIVHNTFVAGSGGWPIKLTQDLGGHTIFNNILLSPNGAIVVGNSNFESNYNIVSDGFSLNEESSIISLSSWRSAGHGQNSIVSTESAVFVGGGDYHLRSGSPAIDAGISSFNGFSAPNVDLEGNSRPFGGGYDAGAYESGSSPSSCDLTSGSWSQNNVEEGTIVTLNVAGTDCDGETISFEVLEYDPASGDDPVTTNPLNVVFSGSATGSWTAEYQDDGLFGGDPEYYFIASVVGDIEQIETGKGDAELLHVSESINTVCGDGVCNGTETSVTCPADCPTSVCGDGVCNGTETSVTCPADCPTSVCGDGVCNGTETNISCPADCNVTPPAYFGDLDNDTKITISDIRIIMGHMLNNEINWEADVNEDGTVNIFDLVRVASIWGKQYGTDTVAPTILGSSPTGVLPVGTTRVILSIDTDERAFCRFSLNPGTNFASMTPFFKTGGIHHTREETGLSDGQTYNYYVKCQDESGNLNSVDYIVDFSIGV
jgi:hypothetical protein